MSTCSIQTYWAGTNFFRAHAGEFNFDSLGKPAQTNDWGNSIYFSRSKSIAEGYLEEGKRSILTFINKKTINYILCKHSCFKDSTYEKHMDSIIKEIESLIGKNKPQGVPFMRWLGENGYAFQCYHDPETDSMETILPLQLMTEENWSITR